MLVLVSLWINAISVECGRPILSRTRSIQVELDELGDIVEGTPRQALPPNSSASMCNRSSKCSQSDVKWNVHKALHDTRQYPSHLALIQHHANAGYNEHAMKSNKSKIMPLICCAFACIIFLAGGAVHYYSESAIHSDAQATCDCSTHADDTVLACRDQSSIVTFPRFLGGSAAALADLPFHVDVVPSPWLPASLLSCLRDNSIDIRNWANVAVENLSRELRNGKARLFHNNRLVRVVDIVLVIVEYIPDRVVAKEVFHSQHERTFREMPERVPKARIESRENLAEAVCRCLNEKLGIPESCIPHVDYVSMDEVEESVDSLPNLTSIVRKFITHVRLEKMDPKLCDDLGLTSGRLSRNGRVFAWEPIAQVRALQKYLSKKEVDGTARSVLGHDAEPVLLWDKPTIVGLLAQHSISSTQDAFGIPLKDFVSMLKAGTYSLGVCPSSKKLFCVEDMVLLCVSANSLPSGNEEMQLSGRKFANESAWAAALRLSYSKFGAGASLLQFDCSEDVVTTRQDSGDTSIANSPGRVISRKFRVRVVASQVPQHSHMQTLLQANAESESSDDAH